MPILIRTLASALALLFPTGVPIAWQAGFFFGSNYTVASGCTTPTGSNFTESFGDAATSCGFGATSNCDHTWSQTGSAASIVSTPASAPANTACANSLQMALGSTAAYISNSFPGISGAFDVQGTVYVSNDLANGNADFVFCVTTSGGTCDTGGTIVGLVIDDNNVCTGLGFRGTGSTNSTCIPYSPNTWYTFKLHRDTVAASDTLTINSTTQSFTGNDGTAAAVYIGTSHFGTNAATFVLGNMYF